MTELLVVEPLDASVHLDLVAEDTGREHVGCDQRVVVVGEGVFHETMNLAELWSLPVLFV